MILSSQGVLYYRLKGCDIILRVIRVVQCATCVKNLGVKIFRLNFALFNFKNLQLGHFVRSEERHPKRYQYDSL